MEFEGRSTRLALARDQRKRRSIGASLPAVPVCQTGLHAGRFDNLECEADLSEETLTLARIRETKTRASSML